MEIQVYFTELRCTSPSVPHHPPQPGYAWRGGGVRLPPAPPPCIRPCPMYPSLVCQLTYCITQLLLVMLVRIHIKY